jgi:tape measure domain-containing protein
MSEAEIKITADAQGARREIAGFRKEYSDLVQAIQKPMGQIDALQKTQQDAKKAAAEFFAAKTEVDALKQAIKQAGQPVKELDRELVKAERSLARATVQFDRQKASVKTQRAELRAAGVDTRNLAAEQQRLQGALAGAVGKGQADAVITKSLDQFGVTKLRDLRAQLVGLQADYKRLTQAGVLSATERMAAEIQYKARVEQTKRAIRELTVEQGGNGGDGGMAAITAKLAGLMAAAYTVQRLSGVFFSIADEMNTLEDRMRNALPITAEYDRAWASLEDTSKRVRIPLAQTGELFLGLIGPMKEAGFSAQATAKTVGALSAALVANSVKGQQADAVLSQLSIGLQTGKVQGDAFRAVLTKLPAVVGALTKSLGVSREELIRMAGAGKLTTEEFVKAIEGDFEAIMALADKMRDTTGDATGTFTDSIKKAVQAIDTLTGASERAVKELDNVSGAINSFVAGDMEKGFSQLGESLSFFAKKATPAGLIITGLNENLRKLGAELSALSGWDGADIGKYLDLLAEPSEARESVTKSALAALAQAYRSFAGESKAALEEAVAAEKAAADESERIKEERLAAMRSYSAEFMAQHKQLNIDFKKALDDQVTAQNKAKSALTKAQNEQVATQKRYKDALAKLNAGVAGPASFGNAMALRDASQQALANKDVERAKKLAQEALKMLSDLAEAGANTYGFQGFMQELQGIEEAADKISVEKAKNSFEEAREKTRLWKVELEDLKNFKLSPSVDDAALAAASEKLKKWGATIGQSIAIAPRVLPEDPRKVPGSADKEGYVFVESMPPTPVDVVIKDVLPPDGVPPVVDAVINPIAVAVEAPPVQVAVETDSEAVSTVTGFLQGLAAQWRSILTIPLTIVGGASPTPTPTPGYATGTRSAPPGMAWVGERGPELLQFRGGERVFPAGESLRMSASVPDIPTPSQALLDAGRAPEIPHLGRMDISLGGSDPVTIQGTPDALRELSIAARKFGRTRR